MISIQDIQDHAKYLARGDRHVFGYFGASERSTTTDVLLMKAANRLGLDMVDVDLWGNSTYARHFMNGEPKTIKAFVDVLVQTLPNLRSHTLAYHGFAAFGASKVHKYRREFGTRKEIKFRLETRVAMLRDEADRLERALRGSRW